MKRYYILFMMVIGLGCKKPYNPPVINSPYSYLVVQGIINSGADSTIINLSRSVNVSAKSSVNPELHATLIVESDKNASYTLTETDKGNYVSAGLNLDTSGHYRLRIKTANNELYLSDFVPVKVTPPIDSIGFNVTVAPDTGVQIYVNAHDPKNGTRYYRWDYNEDWEFHAKYFSQIIRTIAGIGPRPPDQEIYYCYNGDVSSTIVVGSTAKLAKDILYQSPIVFIPAQSEKIETKYSILLRQYALTADAFVFWQNIKKNTEQLGSIFDAEPTATIGNIHNLNATGPLAIGYVSVGTIQTKRVFIPNTLLPRWEPHYPYVCGLDTNYVDGLIAVDLKSGSFQKPGPVEYGPPDCVDCTVRGSKIPPPFWK